MLFSDKMEKERIISYIYTHILGFFYSCIMEYVRMSIAIYCMVHCAPNAEQKQTVNRLGRSFVFFFL